MDAEKNRWRIGEVFGVRAPTRSERWSFICFSLVSLIGAGLPFVRWHEYVPIPGFPHDNSPLTWLPNVVLAAAFAVAACYRVSEPLWPITKRERLLLLIPAVYSLIAGIWEVIRWSRYVPIPGYPLDHSAWPWVVFLCVAVALGCAAVVVPVDDAKAA